MECETQSLAQDILLPSIDPFFVSQKAVSSSASSAPNASSSSSSLKAAAKSPEMTLKQKLQKRATALMERHLLKLDTEAGEDQQSETERQLRQIAATLLDRTPSLSVADAGR